jgi:preprotein translocase subunit SecE
LGVRVPPPVLKAKRKNKIFMKDKIVAYFEDIFREMKKVSWPKRDELIDSTKVVVVTMLIFSVFVYVVDKGISEILKVIF